MKSLRLAALLVLSMVAACSGDSEGPVAGDGADVLDAGVGNFDGQNVDGSAEGGGPGAQFAELWYCVDQLLVRVELDSTDGSVEKVEPSTIVLPLDTGQTAITMLEDGGLLVSRLSKVDFTSRFFLIPSPPRDGSDVEPLEIGVMPDDIMVEGLYTDCEGRVYAMDTGVDDGSAQGNRLLRFTRDIAAGDFSFVVVSDLATADVADIDDMSPGIDNNRITDNPGLAIDTGNIYAFNYETGSGTLVAQAGTFGIHALGGSLFKDGKSRLYLLNSNAELFEVDARDFSVSDVLGRGPTPAQGTPGWSSLAGPLTDCTTGFTPPK